MQDLKISIVQTPLHWENSAANLAMLEEKIWRHSDLGDLIILPEMFSTGFSMNASSLAEPMNLTSFKWMKQMAAQTGAVVTGSLIIKEKAAYYNRLIWMQPDGSYNYYDKRHLFRMAGEHDVYSSGKEPLIVTLKGWRIMPLVCYDLRFPVWSRNQGNIYDLLIYVANWPEVRSQAWKTLLPARAIENISYVAGVNRIGKDGKDIPYSGDSAVYNMKGDVLADLGNQDVIKTLTLSASDLVTFRERFPAFLDGDRFRIED